MYLYYYHLEMPTCCIKNCKSRSSGATKSKIIKFFRFPQTRTLKEKWFEACHRKEENLKVNSGKYDHLKNTFVIKYNKI